MLENIVKRIVKSGFYKLTGKMLTTMEDERLIYYSDKELTNTLNSYNAKKIAIYFDASTDIELLKELHNNFEIVGYYCSYLELVNTEVNGIKVQLLPLNQKINADCWIISSTSPFPIFSLDKYLVDTDSTHIFAINHLIHEHRTKYYSYIDFFTDEGVETTVQIHNYLDYCYRNPYALNLKLTLRNGDGTILSRKQVIIPSNGIKVIKSSDFENKLVKGYLEVEFEIPVKIIPFLHYYANYINRDAISNNHQSGLGLMKAKSNFTRGYIPTKEEDSLEVCLFQHHYENPINIKAILRYYIDGKVHLKEKPFPLLHQNEMLFIDIKEHFNDIDFTSIDAPVVIVNSEEPLHRPNFYYTTKGKKGFYDTTHAGADLSIYVDVDSPAIAKDYIQKIKKLNCEPYHTVCNQFPPKMNIDSLIGGWNDTSINFSRHRIELHNSDGVLIHIFPKVKIDYNKATYFNLSEFIRANGIKDFTGSISILAEDSDIDIPGMTYLHTAFIQKDKDYITSTAGNGPNVVNVPFINRIVINDLRGPSITLGSDIYGPGICNDIYDTLFIISNKVSDNNCTKEARMELTLFNENGERRVLEKRIQPKGVTSIQLSELIEETNFDSPQGYYSLWSFSNDTALHMDRLLIRKEDQAISFEHCYSGKFGI